MGNGVQRHRTDGAFYGLVAVVAALVAFAGFARTIHQGAVDGPPLTDLVHAHGVVMTAWVALFLAQARLVACGGSICSRRLGVIGGALAALLASWTSSRRYEADAARIDTGPIAAAR